MYVAGMRQMARNVTPKYEASEPESSYDIPGAMTAGLPRGARPLIQEMRCERQECRGRVTFDDTAMSVSSFHAYFALRAYSEPGMIRRLIPMMCLWRKADKRRQQSEPIPSSPSLHLSTLFDLLVVIYNSQHVPPSRPYRGPIVRARRSP